MVVTVPASVAATKAIVTIFVSISPQIPRTPAFASPSEEVSIALSCIVLLMISVVKVFGPVTVILVDGYSLHAKPPVGLVSHLYIIPSVMFNSKLARAPIQIGLEEVERGSEIGVFATIICSSLEYTPVSQPPFSINTLKSVVAVNCPVV